MGPCMGPQRNVLRAKYTYIVYGIHNLEQVHHCQRVQAKEAFLHPHHCRGRGPRECTADLVAKWVRGIELKKKRTDEELLMNGVPHHGHKIRPMTLPVHCDVRVHCISALKFGA